MLCTVGHRGPEPASHAFCMQRVVGRGPQSIQINRFQPLDIPPLAVILLKVISQGFITQDILSKRLSYHTQGEYRTRGLDDIPQEIIPEEVIPPYIIPQEIVSQETVPRRLSYSPLPQFPPAFWFYVCTTSPSAKASSAVDALVRPPNGVLLPLPFLPSLRAVNL